MYALALLASLLATGELRRVLWSGSVPPPGSQEPSSPTAGGLALRSLPRERLAKPRSAQAQIGAGVRGDLFPSLSNPEWGRLGGEGDGVSRVCRLCARPCG